MEEGCALLWEDNEGHDGVMENQGQMLHTEKEADLMWCEMRLRRCGGDPVAGLAVWCNQRARVVG